MKKIGKVLLVCMLFLGMVSFMKEDAVKAAAGERFIAKIKNIKLDGSTQEIEWNFQIIEGPEGNELGTVCISDGIDDSSRSIEGSIIIPEEVSDSTNTYRVIEIENSAFASCSSLKNVTAENPANITKIGDNAFDGCTSLESIGLENYTNLQSIGEYTFFDCISLTSTGLARNNSIISIGDRAFQGCTSLESTGLENNTSVKSIGEYAFLSCTSLEATGLETNATIETIGDYAFWGCTSLIKTGLESNEKLSKVGNNIFAGCTSLLSTGLQTNSTIKELGDYAFAGCSNITSTGLEKNTTIKSIGDHAFYLCSSLIATGLNKNTSVESIGENAFDDCRNLTAFFFVKDSIPTLAPNSFPDTATLYYYSGMASDEIDKLREPRKAYEIIEFDVDGDTLRGNYIAGEEFTLQDVGFDVVYGDSVLEEDINFEGSILYDEDIDEFTYTPIILSNGVNTITGKYQDVEFSFDVNATALSYDVTVKNGTTDKVKYDVGEIVTISANASESGKSFKNWKVDSGTVTLANANKKTTTFVMPKHAVVVEAQYESASVPPLEEPEIIIGAGFTYQISKNKDMEVTCSGKLEDLVEVYVDGVILHKDHYTLRSGSTIITLDADYLNSLTIGKHTLRLQYKDDVSAKTYFLIEGNGQEGTKSPSTGDRTMVGLWIINMLCAGGCIVYGYKRKHTNIKGL